MEIIITLPHIRKTASFQTCIFLSTITFQFLFHFRGQRHLLLFNDTLFAQEISKELILLCMDYDRALRLENVESQKQEVISLSNFEEVYENSWFPSSIQAPILVE